MSTSLRPAFQLYSVRSLDDPLEDVVEDVSEAGFEGVEFGPRIRDASTEAVSAALSATGTTAVGVHAPLDSIEAALSGDDDLLSRCKAIDCDRVVIPHLPISKFRSQNTTGALADRLGTVAEGLGRRGFDLGLHTARQYHWPVLPEAADGLLNTTPYPTGIWNVLSGLVSQPSFVDPDVTYETALSHLMAQVSDLPIHIQAEVAEFRAAGTDPAAALTRYSDRVETVHLRDVSATRWYGRYRNVPHGTGAVDMKEVVETARRNGIEWLIYENELEKAPELKIRDGAMFLDRLLD